MKPWTTPTRLALVLGVVSVPALALLGAGALLSQRLEVLTGDLSAFCAPPRGAALFTFVGVLLAWGGAAIVAFAGAAAVGLSRHARTLLLSLGVWTGLLSIDDLFELHERKLPALGIPQPLVIAAYPLSLLEILWRGRDVVRRREPWLLALAIGLLSLSVVADLVGPALVPPGLEDGAKLSGLVAWSVWLGLLATCALREEPA